MPAVTTFKVNSGKQILNLIKLKLKVVGKICKEWLVKNKKNICGFKTKMVAKTFFKQSIYDIDCKIFC